MAISKKLRFEILKRDDFRCTYCGKSSSQAILQVDHVIPIKEGGANTPDNLTTACIDCNQGKAADMIETDHLAIPKGARKLPGPLYFCEVCAEPTNEYPQIGDADGRHHLCNRCAENWKKESPGTPLRRFKRMHNMMALNE